MYVRAYVVWLNIQLQGAKKKISIFKHVAGNGILLEI